MTRVPRLALLAYGLAILVIVADQALKGWVLGPLDLADKSPIEVLGPFQLSLVKNSGFSFGLLNIGEAWSRWLLCAFSAAVSVALVLWAWRSQGRILACAIGLVLGGAVGNLIDRVRLGEVTDFLDFHRIGFFPWVFNIADSAVSVGAVLLIWDLFLAPRNRAGG